MQFKIVRAYPVKQKEFNEKEKPIRKIEYRIEIDFTGKNGLLIKTYYSEKKNILFLYFDILIHIKWFTSGSRAKYLHPFRKNILYRNLFDIISINKKTTLLHKALKYYIDIRDSYVMFICPSLS